MSSTDRSALLLRFARLSFSLFVIALVSSLLPVAARAQCSTTGNPPVTTCTSSSGITVSSTAYASEGTGITVTGLSGSVTNISMTLNNLSVTNLNDVAMVLVPPSSSGLKPLDFLSGVCGYGTQQIGNSTFTLADSGDTGTDNVSGMIPYLGASCPSAFSGTYLPSDYYPGNDTFDSPGPGTNYNSGGANPAVQGSGTYNFSSFGETGSVMNGTWTLYIANQNNSTEYANPSGALGSWSIAFTGSSLASTTTSLSASPDGTSSLVYTSTNVGNQATSPTTVTVTATVTPNPDGGTVTFYDSTGVSPGTGTAISSPVAVNGSGQAQANVTFPGTEEGPRSITAVFSGTSVYLGSTSSTATVLTTNHPYNNPSGSTTFCNGPVKLNVSGASAPYPSLLALGTSFSQLTGTIENVTVSLNSFNLQNEANLDSLGFLLQAPGSNTTGLGSSGNAFQFLSWAGNPYTSGSLTISDDGASQIPYDTAPPCTTCLPTDNWVDIGSDNSDTYPGPAPSSFTTAAPTGTGTLTTAFGGLGANNTWSLYVDNRYIDPGPAGQLGSWCLNFTMQANAHPTTTTVSGSPNPASITSGATASVNLSANVSVSDGSGPINSGTVAFVDGSTNLGSAPVSNGQATLGVSLAEGTHQIVASYGGTNTGTEFGISNATFDQRVDTATTKPTSGSGAGPYTYCNTGSITAPGLGADAGPAAPYPSNIFVTNLPGTVDAVTVTLNGFSTKDQGDLLSLLVGPGGNNLDFFSLTGSNVSTAPSPFNLIFSDSAASDIAQGSSGNLSSAGTFRPTSYNTNITYPQCPENAPLCASPAVGPPLASNPFTPTNKAAAAGTAILGNANEAGVFGGTSSSTYNGNGTWSLYIDDGGPTGGGEASYLTGGWCVNLTENVPTASVTVGHSGSGTGGDFIQGEQNAQITVQVDSTGPGSTGDPTGGSNPMTVEDGLISDVFSYSNFSGTGWSCSANGGLVTCTNDSSVPDGQAYPELTIDVNVSSTASGSYLNNVGVNGAGVGPTISNNDTITVLANTTTTGFNAEGEYGVPAVPLQATVTSSSGTVNSGSVIFTLFSGSNQVGTSTSGAVSNGVASVLYTLPPGTPPGSYTIQVVYSGSSSFAGSSDNTHTLTMVQAPTTTSASNATTDYSSSPQSVSLSATVTSEVGTVNAGTVTFTVLNGSTPVGTATTSGTVSSGSASVSYTLPAATTIGSYTIQAVYNGSTDFGGSSDNRHMLTVAPSIGTCTTANPNPNPNPVSFAAVGDFNGDCRSDLLWRNSGTEQVYEWLMDGTTFTSSGSPGSLTSDWVIQGSGDFNADGKADVLWRNSTTGEVVIWLM
ncbi:MAG: Ig-like domain repeat protein, partial [Acidobacteriaceae bacterium]